MKWGIEGRFEMWRAPRHSPLALLKVIGGSGEGAVAKAGKGGAASERL